MAGESEGPGDVRQALDRLADLILFPERFREDPRAALEEYGVGPVPNEVVDAIASFSADELRVLSQIHRRQGWAPVGHEAGIFF
jgi:hypothetical protein